jgi:outer membrane protein TolC
MNRVLEPFRGFFNPKTGWSDDLESDLERLEIDEWIETDQAEMKNPPTAHRFIDPDLTSNPIPTPETTMPSRSSFTSKMIANGLLIGLVGCGEQMRQVDIRTDDLVKERNAVLASGIRPAPALSTDSYPEGDPFPKDTPELNEPSTVDPAADDLAFTGRTEAESEADAIIARIRRLADTPADAEPLTLDYAIAFAQQNATEYTGAEETYLLSALSLIVQEHLFEPRFYNETKIDAGEGIGRYDAALRVANDFGVRQRLPYGGEVTARFLAGLTRNIDDASTEGGVQNAGFIVEGRLPLLQGGGIVARESLIQAQRNLVYASRSFEIFRRDFYVAIVTDYLGLVLQLQAIENAERGLALNRQIEELETALVETGRSQPFQADEARKDTLDAVDDLASRQEAYQLSLDRFKVRIGMDPERPMLIIPTEIQIPIPEVDRDQAIHYAMEYRLDLQTNRDQLEDARRQIDLAENGLLPALDLKGDLRVGGNDVVRGVDFGDTRASGGVFLSLPLDRVDESVALRQAQVRFAQDERLYGRSLDDAAVSVRQSIRDIDRAQFSILLQERSVEIAENRIASIDAAPDRATARDRTTAVAGLRTAEDRRDTSKRDLQVSVLNYLNAAGILRLTPEGQLQPLPNMPVGEVIGKR